MALVLKQLFHRKNLETRTNNNGNKAQRSTLIFLTTKPTARTDSLQLRGAITAMASHSPAPAAVRPLHLLLLVKKMRTIRSPPRSSPAGITAHEDLSFFAFLLFSRKFIIFILVHYASLLLLLAPPLTSQWLPILFTDPLLFLFQETLIHSRITIVFQDAR